MLILALLPLVASTPQVKVVEEQSELRSWPKMPSVGDVNGDGVPDLIHERERVLSLVSGADPTVKLSSFLVAAFYPECAGPTWEVGPDVDGDGVRDLAVLNGFALVSTIYLDVFSGRSGMSLGRIEKELPGHVMSVAWTDDIDGDGIGDIAVTDSSTQVYSSKTMALLWSAPTPSAGIAGKSPMDGKVSARLQVGCAEDFDGDGIRDLAIGVKLIGDGAPEAQLGADYNFSYAMVSGKTGAVIDGAPRMPMDALLIDAFAWMSGDWIQRSESNGRTMNIEESWNAPAAGMMLGVSRTSLEGEDKGQFEFLRLSCQGLQVLLYPLPGGQPRDPFRLKSYGPKEAVFENLEHDFPQVIRYWREGEALHASIGTAETPAQVTFEFAAR